MLRMQQIVPTGLVFLLAAIVTWLSFAGEPADAFLFPRLISVAFIVLAGLAFTRALVGMAQSGEGISVEVVRNIAPGLALIVVYVFWAAEALGFYVASTAAVFIVLALYHPAPHGEVRSWLVRVAITCGFMAVMYGLFSMLLNVQTPRGLFF